MCVRARTRGNSSKVMPEYKMLIKLMGPNGTTEEFIVEGKRIKRTIDKIRFKEGVQ